MRHVVLCGCNSQLPPRDDDRTSAFDSPAASVPSSGRNTPTQLSDVVISTSAQFHCLLLLSRAFSRYERVFKVMGCHVHCRSGSISDMLQDRHGTNRKCRVACRFVPSPVTLKVIRSKVIRLFKCCSTNIRATFCKISTDCSRRTVAQRYWSFLLYDVLKTL